MDDKLKPCDHVFPLIFGNKPIVCEKCGAPKPNPMTRKQLNLRVKELEKELDAEQNENSCLGHDIFKLKERIKELEKERKKLSLCARCAQFDCDHYPCSELKALEDCEGHKKLRLKEALEKIERYEKALQKIVNICPVDKKCQNEVTECECNICIAEKALSDQEGE